MKKIILLFFVILIGSCKKDKVINPAANDANHFLSAKNYDKLHLEIVYSPGMEPSDGAVAALKSFLEQHLNKPSGIEISRRALTTGAKTIYSFAELQELEKSNRTVSNNGRTATAYMFFAGGGYEQDQGSSKVLGIAFGSSSMVIFEKTIQDHSGGLTQPSTQAVETSVMNHEFGHLLGLVNNGTAMVNAHQDEAHGKHCDNKNCLMYYATETSDLLANLLNNPVPVLDEACIRDLKANGGK